MDIAIVAYCENWKEAFENEREIILGTFRNHIKAIEHIGSTAIPGQFAKPVIDIFIAVSPFRTVSFYNQVLSAPSYRYTPTDMAVRHLFTKYTGENIWTHNLHILPWDAEFYSRNEILFRDYLRRRPEMVARYNELKKLLVLRNFSSMEEYTKAKTQFIQEVVDIARIEKGLPRQNVWTMEYIKDDR
ncbi:MAG: GrpB family protein [Imperialibacter sp.]